MLINNHYNHQILYLEKEKKEKKKNHIILNFLIYCTGYRLVTYKSKTDVNFKMTNQSK